MSGDETVLTVNPTVMISGLNGNKPENISAARLSEEILFLKQTRALKAATENQIAGIPMPPPVTATGPRIRFEEDIRNRTADMLSIPESQAYSEGFVRYLSNSLPVSVSRPTVSAVAVPYENEAIRPYAGDKFENLLLASACHPAMLLYLDAASSFGPNSRAGASGRRGLNENYAREVMELHTLGSDGGYTQDDVRELALALTGYGVDPETGTAVFRAVRHEPGERRFMGRTYPAGEQEQAMSMLKFLASHPKTGIRFCTRMAVHYFGASPPAPVLESMKTAWRSSGGNLTAVSRAMLEHPLSWTAPSVRFRTPEEFVTAAGRLFALDKYNPRVRNGLMNSLRKLSQYPFSATSPQGYFEDERWMSPDGLLNRASVASEIATLRMASGGVDPRQLAELAGLGEKSMSVVRSAPDVKNGLTLVLMAPEFQRR